MGVDDDFALALKLQRQFEAEVDSIDLEHTTVTPPTKSRRANVPSSVNGIDLDTTTNLVHPEWENIDPTPDIFALFGAFDVKFFQGKLKCVELEWSKKMYSCAGICYQRKSGAGKSCTIRLSEPLLKLRPRKDLVQTLLHEMIHAYLFILNIREGNGGHGPNFCRIMTNINKTTGTNITVYHSFHDEVNVYKTHVWRCNGICQHRKPFYGYVRRTVNRAPGQNDLWWMQHQTSCGGYFQKLSEPEPKRKARSSSGASTKKPPVANQPKINAGRWGFNRNSTVTITDSPKTINSQVPSATNAVPRPSTFGNLSNVVGLKDLNGDSPPKRSNFPAMLTGNGKVLGGTSAVTSTPTQAVTQSVRDRWNKRFADDASTLPLPSDTEPPATKRPKVEKVDGTSKWEIVDDDIQVRDDKPSLILINDSDDDDCVLAIDNINSSVPASRPPINNQSAGGRQAAIKQEILDSINEAHIDGEDDESDIELIDDEFDDNLRNVAVELTDNRVIDDLFGTDTLMADFNEINDVIMKDSENRGQPNKEIITCPICQERMQRDQLDEHLDGCLGITTKVSSVRSEKAVSSVRSRPTTSAATAAAATSSALKSERQILQECGYDDATITRILRDKREERAYNERILTEMASDPATTSRARKPSKAQLKVAAAAAVADRLPCPVCQGQIDADKINDHLDVCLSNETEIV